MKTLNINPVDERQNLTLEADILKSKQIFDSVMNNLRVDILLIHVVTQQKQLEETLTDLSHVETSTLNFTAVINKRIQQLQEASGENNLITELIKCEITSWTSLSTDSPKSSTEFPIDYFENIKSFYSYLISGLKSTEEIKSKSGNLIQIESNEIDNLFDFMIFCFTYLQVLRIYRIL